MTDAPIRIESFESLADGCAATLFVSSPSFMRTSSVPGLADTILEALPGLVRHPCECGSAHGIAAELVDTETPHLIEHVALELLAVSGAPRRELRGRTTWDFARDGAGVFHVSLHGAPPEACAKALGQATALVVGYM
ncbi:MAG: hypothetical protein Q8K89_02620 [Actinomycetota bacterium]|nr:hypothetical protein [Actinomycetota bacterium]